jgi:hypothetical protein
MCHLCIHVRDVKGHLKLEIRNPIKVFQRTNQTIKLRSNSDSMTRTGTKRPPESRERLIREPLTGLKVAKSRKISEFIRPAQKRSYKAKIPPGVLKKVADILDKQTTNTDLKVSWFFGMQAHLDGKSPVELLESGQVKRVLTDARHFMKGLKSNSLYVSRKEHERVLKLVIRHWRERYIKLERKIEALQKKLKKTIPSKNTL